MHSRLPNPTERSAKRARFSSTRRSPQRTCVGCGKTDSKESLLRLVSGPEGEIAFDLANHAVGRGAHVHASPSCLANAAQKGLSKAFRGNYSCSLSSLAQELQAAADRRLCGLLTSALLSGNTVVGKQSVVAELQKNKIELVVMACDASESLCPTLLKAVDEGRAVAWGSKAQLGAVLRRPIAAIVGVRCTSLGNAIAEVCRIADSARSCSEVR